MIIYSLVMLVTFRSIGGLSFQVNIDTDELADAPALGSFMYAAVAAFFGISQFEFNLICLDNPGGDPFESTIPRTATPYVCKRAMIVPTAERVRQALKVFAYKRAKALEKEPTLARRGASVSERASKRATNMERRLADAKKKLAQSTNSAYAYRELIPKYERAEAALNRKKIAHAAAKARYAAARAASSAAVDETANSLSSLSFAPEATGGRRYSRRRSNSRRRSKTPRRSPYRSKTPRRSYSRRRS